MTSSAAELLAAKNRFLHTLADDADGAVHPPLTAQQQVQTRDLYDHLNTNGDDHLSDAELYAAIDSTVAIQRDRFAMAAGVCALITFMYGVLYWVMYRRLLAAGYHSIYRSLYTTSSPWASHLITPA